MTHLNSLSQFTPADQPDDMDEITVPCNRHELDGCQHAVTTTKYLHRIFGAGPTCPECLTKAQKQLNAAMPDPNLQRWQRLTEECPIYRETDINHGGFPLSFYREHIEPWRYGSKGLYLYGPSRTGKTRCMMLLVEREVKAGRSAQVLFSGDISSISRNFSSEIGRDQIKQRLASVDLLAIDDLYSERLTDTGESFLFEMYDARMRAGKPTLITTNRLRGDILGDETHQGTFQDHKRAEAFFNRLRETLTPIKF